MVVREIEAGGERFNVQVSGDVHPLMLLHLVQKLDIAKERIALRFTGAEIALLQVVLRDKLAELVKSE